MTAEEIMKDRPLAFMCGKCLLHYKDKKSAEKCETWCKKHSSCNLKTTRNSMERIEIKK